MNDSILHSDVREFASQFPHYARLRDMRILLTGSTGLVGGMLLRTQYAEGLGNVFRSQR